MSPLFAQFASGFCWIIYGSFFEWYWHKYWMHVPRVPKEAFRGHTIVHHGLYKGDDSYFVPEGQHPEHILLKPYALPAIVLAHIPVMLLIEHFVARNTAIGGVIACTLYFVVYEYMHWNMHVPRGHFVERFRWFQYLRDHHHLHHRYQQKNFCVLFPLADLVFGTLETKESMARKKAEREAAIASGMKAPPRKKLRRDQKPGIAQIELLRQQKRARSHEEWKQKRERFRAEKLPRSQS